MNRAHVMEAPVGLLPLPRPLMTGEVLDAAFRLFRASVIRCLPYSALVALTIEMPTIYRMFIDDSFVAMYGGRAKPIAHGIAMAFAVPLLGALSLRLNSVAIGERPRFRRELLTALIRWPPGIIATFGAFLIPVVLFWLGPWFANGLTSEAVLFLSIPLFWPTALFVLALPAFWCRRMNPFLAIWHSIRITIRGSWRMIAAILGSVAVVAVFYLLVAVITWVVIPIFMSADLVLLATVRALLNLVVGTFGVPFVTTMLIVALSDFELRDQERRAVAR